jgi:hypothetical protein
MSKDQKLRIYNGVFEKQPMSLEKSNLELTEK